MEFDDLQLQAVALGDLLRDFGDLRVRAGGDADTDHLLRVG
jgi:hypothetical protein